jgi:hypothetical protein
MFVGILAEPAGLSRNDRATELFFDYVRAMKPHVAIESLSPIQVQPSCSTSRSGCLSSSCPPDGLTRKQASRLA